MVNSLAVGQIPVVLYLLVKFYVLVQVSVQKAVPFFKNYFLFSCSINFSNLFWDNFLIIFAE